MAIAKKPKAASSTTTEQERERQERAFLAGSPDFANATKSDDAKMQTVHLRFEPEMLPRVDAAAKEMGLGSRSAWVRYAVMQALKTQEK
jgi:hypothetical protein